MKIKPIRTERDNENALKRIEKLWGSKPGTPEGEEINMQPKKELKLFIEKYRNDPGYILEGVLIDITEQIARLMVEYKMNRVQLANKLKCSPAYITKLMNGDENLTVKKLVQIAMALGADI